MIRRKEKKKMQMPGPKRRGVERGPSGPILSLDEHEHSITELTNRAAPGRSAQPSGKNLSSAQKDRVRPWKDPVPVPDTSDESPCRIKLTNLKQRPTSGIPYQSWSLSMTMTALSSQKAEDSEEAVTSGGGGYRETCTAPQGQGPSCAVQSRVSCPSGLSEQVHSESQGASKHR